MPKHHHRPPHHFDHPPHGPHGDSLHDSRAHPAGHHPGHRSERLLDSTAYQGAAVTLEKLLPTKFVTRMTRAMMDCPPEILALFRVHTATIELQLRQLEAADVPVPQFDPVDLADSEASQRALSVTLKGSQQRGCLEDLMHGPVEVQAVSFLSLISLRLADMASAAPMTEEVEVVG